MLWFSKNSADRDNTMTEHRIARNSLQNNPTIQRVDRTLGVLTPGTFKAQFKREAPNSRHPASPSLDSESEESDGWETDLECEETKSEFDLTGRTMYVRACEKLGVIPASYFVRHMTEPEVAMMHHGLGPVGIQAMSLALLYNTTITSLNLRDNGIGEEGGETLAKLLRENYYISDLDISDNLIGSRGAIELGKTLKENTTLTKLSLAGNDFKDKDADILCDALLNNSTLTHLDLSHNQLSNHACVNLGKLLDESITLVSLDLSWNHVQLKGARLLAKGLAGNVKLKYFNLAWNGIGAAGTDALARALLENSTMLEIDLSNNRMEERGAYSFARCLESNSSLEVVRLAKNGLNSNGACSILSSIMKNSDSRIKKIDLTGAVLRSEFYSIVEDLKSIKQDVVIITDATPEAKEKPETPDPRVLLREYITKEHVPLVDLFRRLDQDGSMSVNVKEFVEGLKQSDVGLTQFEVERIIDVLDADKDGEIDYSELVSIQDSFRKFDSENERKVAKKVNY